MPTHDQSPRESTSEVLVPDRRRNHRRIVVIVDDDPNTLDRVTLMLEREGYHVLTAADATQGIALVGVRQPAALVCNLNLHAGDAWTVCALARAQLSDQAPVILLNFGHRDEPDNDTKARALGVSILDASGLDQNEGAFARLLQHLPSCARDLAAG